MKNSLLPVLVLLPLFSLSQLTPKSLVSSKESFGFYEFKPPGYNPDSTYKYPLIIFLHGVGERGNGTTELPMALLASFPKLLVANATMQFEWNGRKHAFLVLLPQMSKQYINWQNFYVDEMIRYAKANLNIDENKIFLTGWSLGGGGVWKYSTSSPGRAGQIAGIIPVSPAPDYTNLCNLSRGGVAVWAHHARDDASVPIHFTIDAIQGIKECSPRVPPLITTYSSGGHPFVANKAYDTLNSLQYPNIYQWMLGTSRLNNPENNMDPVAIAGNDTTITVPSISTVLNGMASYDPNDVIIKYRWLLLDGPVSPNLVLDRPYFPISRVSGLEPGKYTFRLYVTDQFGKSRYDDVQVLSDLPPSGKNAAPLVDAGRSIQTISNYYQVRANARDFDGHIRSYTWRQLAGPLPLVIKSYGKVADIIGMEVPGTYVIEFSASDNGSPSKQGKDTLMIMRKSILPFDIFYWSFKLKDKLFSGIDTGSAGQTSYSNNGSTPQRYFSFFTSFLVILIGYVHWYTTRRHLVLSFHRNGYAVDGLFM